MCCVNRPQVGPWRYLHWQRSQIEKFRWIDLTHFLFRPCNWAHKISNLIEHTRYALFECLYILNREWADGWCMRHDGYADFPYDNLNFPSIRYSSTACNRPSPNMHYDKMQYNCIPSSLLCGVLTYLSVHHVWIATIFTTTTRIKDHAHIPVLRKSSTMSVSILVSKYRCTRQDTSKYVYRDGREDGMDFSIRSGTLPRRCDASSLWE